MSINWRGWCRLCADAGGIGIDIFANEDFVWPDRIIKYLSISVNDEDGMPQSVCEACCQRITLFDHYAEQCLRVQAMFQAMSTQNDENDTKVGLIRAEFLQENNESETSKRNTENKKDVELMAIDTDPFLLSENSCPPIKRTYKLKPGRKKNPRMKSLLKGHKKTPVSKIKLEDPERRSSRLQVLAQTQLDYGIDSSSEAKPECDNFVESEIVLPRKRGRPPKRLVGAAKRKSKKPRVVKPKKNLVADEDFDDLGVEVKSESDKVNQPSIFRWECHICGEMARNWNSLGMHTKLVHEVPAQVLCLCAKVLSSRASIIKHRLKHTDGYKYKCEKCDKSFHRRGCYELHVLSHVPKEEQPFVCCKCARRFHCEALLRQHEKVHLPREERLIYPCTTCHKKFSSKSAVSAHIKSIHFGERPFVCDQCGHSFTSKGILQEHLTIHSDETPFKCQHCHKSFKTKYRLKIHLDIHRETPYQCPVCPLQLSTRRTLRMHLVVHKDTKAFQCSTCGKAFRRAKDLKNHHNLHTGRRPYTCTFCPRTFANGSNCRSHKRRMHPEELRVYEAALAAAEHLANNPGAPPLPAAAPAAAAPQPPPQPVEAARPAQPQQQSMISQADAMTASQPTTNVSASGNQQMLSTNQDFQRHALFNNASNSMKNLLNVDVSRAPTTMVNSYQGQNTVSRVSNSNMEQQQSHDNNVLGGLTVGSRNSQSAPRNGHHYAGGGGGGGMQEGGGGGGGMQDGGGEDCNGGDRSGRAVLHGHLPTAAPLNLNISQLHANRHQMGGNLGGMGEAERRLESYHAQRSQMPNLNQGHPPNLTSNLHQLRQQQNFGLNRGANERVANLNRSGRDGTELNRSVAERDLGNPNLNQMHHNTEHPNILQGYTTSLNHLYQHPGSVAVAMAHSSTVGVPAFPGNPYVHHGMGSSLSNYQRGNGNM